MARTPDCRRNGPDPRNRPLVPELAELVPHIRIAFTWETPFSVDGSIVTIELSPVAEGTDVILTHVKFATAESRDNHAKGWAMILTNLDSILSSR